MNIALSAVIISILLIPPVAFYVSFFFGRYPKAGPKFSFLDGILASAAISLLIHSFGLSILNQEIRFDILLKVLGGELKDLETKISNNDFHQALKGFIWYNSVIILIAVLMGRTSRVIAISTGLHAQSEFFRLYNKWWYFFNGYFEVKKEYDLVFVDAVVDTNDGTMIYSGYLVDFVVKSDELDRIYLKDVVRREFKKCSENINSNNLINQTGIPIAIPGDILSVSYSNILNLNIHFLVIDKTLDEIEQLTE